MKDYEQARERARKLVCTGCGERGMQWKGDLRERRWFGLFGWRYFNIYYCHGCGNFDKHEFRSPDGRWEVLLSSDYFFCTPLSCSLCRRRLLPDHWSLAEE